MENIEALTLAMLFLALGLGIIAAFMLPAGQVIAAIVVALYLVFMSFSPLTSAWFAHILVDDLGLGRTAYEITTAMVAGFGFATAATFACNLVRGRVRGGGLPPAV
ncbi:MAG: hypothetical protein IT342_26470 [Candidatus Melainabacteria bacterium]|nr:hypothetical protein [Candidatus Melainabacteria bacterium]